MSLIPVRFRIDGLRVGEDHPFVIYSYNRVEITKRLERIQEGRSPHRSLILTRIDRDGSESVLWQQ